MSIKNEVDSRSSSRRRLLTRGAPRSFCAATGQRLITIVQFLLPLELTLPEPAHHSKARRTYGEGDLGDHIGTSAELERYAPFE